MTLRVGLPMLLVPLLGVLLPMMLGGCVSRGSGIKTFAPPPSDVMPRRVLVVKRGEVDADFDSFIDGIMVEVYLFNNDRQDEGADQPFHRAGTLAFKLYGPQSELLCEGEFEAPTMARSEAEGFFGSGYGLQILFGPRGYEDVRDRVGARMDFEFIPSADPDARAYGSTQIRLGPMF